MIIKNAIRCNICGDEIESKHRHDYVRCKCGACAVDGGHDYLRRSFSKITDYTDLSITQSDHSLANVPTKELEACKTPDATYQIGGATYLVSREFSETATRNDLIMKRILQEQTKQDQNDT